MSFDINTARQAVGKGEIKIQKGEGITHALMRAADTANASKGVKDLEKEFRALDATNKRAIMDLAKEVGNNAPFKGRALSAKGYGVTDQAKIGETLSISAPAPAASTPAASTPAASTPAAPQAAPSASAVAPSASAVAPSASAVAPSASAVAPDLFTIDILEKQKVQALIAELELKGISIVPNMKYLGGSMMYPQKALVKQSDGEYFLWDVPTPIGRNVYRLDANKNIIGMVQVQMNGAEVLKKGNIGKVNYAVPTNVKTK